MRSSEVSDWNQGLFDRRISPAIDVIEHSDNFTVSLPSVVDADKVEASFNNGVLKITPPKREEANTKRIELNTSKLEMPGVGKNQLDIDVP